MHILARSIVSSTGIPGADRIVSDELTFQKEELLFYAARNSFSEIEHYLCGHVGGKGNN